MPMKTGDADSSGIPSNVPAFLVKLWRLVEDPQYEEHISWNKASLSWIIYHTHLSLYFFLFSNKTTLSSRNLDHRYFVNFTIIPWQVRTQLQQPFYLFLAEWKWFPRSRSGYLCTRNPSEVFQTQQFCELCSSAEYV